jgi:hypothetical protein
VQRSGEAIETRPVVYAIEIPGDFDGFLPVGIEFTVKLGGFFGFRVAVPAGET